MSEKGKTETKSDKSKDAFQAEFEALPLDEKFSRLFKMEAATIGETITYVVDNSAKVFDKAVEAMNEFGRKAQADCADKADKKEPGTKSKDKPKDKAKDEKVTDEGEIG